MCGFDFRGRKDCNCDATPRVFRYSAKDLFYLLYIANELGVDGYKPQFLGKVEGGTAWSTNASFEAGLDVGVRAKLWRLGESAGFCVEK